VLSISKDKFEDFITNQLGKVMKLIHDKSTKVFVPISVSNNPLNLQNEMFILLKSSEKVDFMSDHMGLDVAAVK